MPLYDYLCTKCNTPCERLVKYEERDQQVCDCGYMMLRQLSAASFRMDSRGMGVKLASGQKVKGHFGKAAARKRGK